MGNFLKDIPYTEGIIEDSLGAVSGLNGEQIDNIKDELSDSETRAQGINDIGTAADNMTANIRDKSVDNRSIVARARNSVMQFPIYAVQTLRVNEAHTIGALFERVYATLVQTVLSQNPIIDEADANDLKFLKKFHTNIKEAAEVLTNKYYEPIDDIDAMMKESVFYSQRLTDNCYVEFQVYPADMVPELITENARLINEPLTGFNGFFEDASTRKDTTIRSEDRVVTLSDNDLRDMVLNLSLNGDDSYATYDDNAKDIINTPDNKDTSPDEKMKKQEILDNLNADVVTLKDKIKSGKLGARYQYSNGRYVRVDNAKSKTTTNTNITDAVRAPELLRDADIKKMNKLLPYTIKATFRIRSKDGSVKDVQYVLGIKSVLHLIRTQDLADDLRDLVTGNIHSLQKVRYKTGEISLVDYLFNVKSIKNDAAKSINYNKRWINTLRRLAEYNKLHGSLLKQPTKFMAMLDQGAVPIPNATLVLTQSDVTALTNQTGIDLSVVANTKRLAKNLFLIAVVIVDQSAGTMRVLFPDSDNSWDVQSLASIDAELAKTDNSQFMSELKRMVNH